MLAVRDFYYQSNSMAMIISLNDREAKKKRIHFPFHKKTRMLKMKWQENKRERKREREKT